MTTTTRNFTQGLTAVAVPAIALYTTVLLLALVVGCGTGNPTQQITADVPTQENPTPKPVAVVQFDMAGFNLSLQALIQQPDADLYSAAEEMKESFLEDYVDASGASGEDLSALREELDQKIAEAIESTQVAS